MSDVQILGITSARLKLQRAKREYEAAKLRDIAYRGVHYQPDHHAVETHGTFSYRGNVYTK